MADAPPSSIKNALRRSFADKANDFALTLNTLSLALSGLEGDVEDQLTHVQRLQANLPPLDAFLAGIAELDARCTEAHIEENDFTTYTHDELAYELALARAAVARKRAFLENQRVIARGMTNLTPIQLEEFESVFRHFDRDGTNALPAVDFAAALASLGLTYDDDEMQRVFREASRGARACNGSNGSGSSGLGGGGGGAVGFEGFIRFMVGVTEDQFSADQVFQSFREVADGKVRPLFPPDFLRTLPFLGTTPPMKNVYSLWVCSIAIRHRTRPPPLPRPRRSHRRPYRHDAATQGA